MLMIDRITINHYRKEAEQIFPLSESAAIDMDYLLCSVLEEAPAFLITHGEEKLSASDKKMLDAYIAERQKGIPIAYILEEKSFWTLDFNVGPETLIPRPETELLVEKALEKVTAKNARVLDLGTGTGAIAMSLASERPGWQVEAVDKNPEAVMLARNNKFRVGTDNVEVYQSNWFSQVPREEFDLIVSNPPYIAEDDEHLKKGDVRFEPRSALVSGKDGLDDIRLIVFKSKNYLKPNALLMIEHGWNQGRKVRELYAMAGFRRVETIRDYGGQERVTMGYRG